MTVIVKHNKTNSITDWTQAQLDEQIALGNFAPGTTLANIVLPSDWNNDHTLTGLGTMAEQDATAVAITGGTINNTTIGATTASTGTFTTLIGGANVANYGQLTGGATTKAVEFVALGTDSNISIALDSKGTGAIDLAAGSSGVNISNGGTVTAITRITGGTLYTTSPTIAISAPTTAGGVTATATCTLGLISSSTIGSGGTGYTVGNVLTLVGGTSTVVAQITVSTVSSGVITGFTVSASGTYTAAPSNPASLSGGTGSGATLNTNFTVNSTFTITNAGSGYIEQPTVTFSGGGGSGAAAYATVGGTPQIKGLGSLLNFYVANQNIALQLEDTGGTGTAYWKFRAANGATNPLMISSAAGGQIATAGTSPLILQTNSSIAQLHVSHTASAVNYVQVTGSATGAAASSLGGLSFTGSDASPNFAIGTKGTGYIAFYGGAATNVQAFRINTTSAANTGNLLQVQGAAAGSAPSILAIAGTSGTDTNIDIKFTPLGTGVVQFGTYTGTILTPTGFITIKDSGGTSRRLLVG
jgi:hypothetical protein